jgi:hypothetical protein
MIVNAIIDWACGFASWIASLFPVWNVPPSLASPGSLVNTVMASAVGLGAWVDWTVFAAVVGAVVGTYVVMFAVKLLLRIASYLPFVGGAG